MKLNLALIQPYLDALDSPLNKVEIKGVAHYSATVINVRDKTIHLQLSEDATARLPYDGDVAVKPGATILFTADGSITEVVIPPVKERAAATQTGRRSPDKVMGQGICAARRD